MTLNHKSFGDGKPLVILHGLLGSLDNWVTVSKYLAKKYKVYIIDLPNHGKSYHTKYFSYENMANDLDSFFVENGLTKFSLLGHSMGGKLALKYVDMFKDKIDKLILVDIANKNYESTRFNNVFDAIFSISLNNLETRKDADSIVSEIIKNAGERHFVLKNLKRTSQGFEWSPNINLLYSNLSAISSKIILNNKVKNSTLLILGENSNYFTDQDKNDLSNEFEKYLIKSVKNSGHWVHAENPKDFILVLEAFLGSRM